MTLESWSMGISRPVLEVHSWAWIYFVSFVLISAFVMMNVVVGIVVNTISEASDSNEVDDLVTDKEKPRTKLHEEVRVLKEQLHKVELYPDGDYTEVSIGMYVESLRNVSIADSSFEAVFYLWFSWVGEKEFSPGDSFQIVGGEISEKAVVSEHYDGNENYQRYKVTATIDKFYDLTRFSLEDHMINIYIEDTTRDGAKLRYVADTEETNISSRVEVPGFEVYDGIHSTVKPHSYKSTYSSPSADGADERVFSQYIIGIPINRTDIGFFLRIIIPYFLSVLLGLFSLFSHKTDADSLGLSGASFFGVVANAYVVSALIPANGGGFGITDMINAMSLMSVIFVVIMSLYSLNARSKLEEGEDNTFLHSIDRAAFFGIGIGYTLFVIILPLSAMLFI